MRIHLNIEDFTSETASYLVSQVNELQSLGLKIKSITLDPADCSEVPFKGSKWNYILQSPHLINAQEELQIMEILDPDNAGSFKMNHSGHIYRFTLEVY